MKVIVLLSVVAFAIATPINEKPVKDAVNPANPDISKLPLKKDDVKIEPVHKTPAQGVQAHPLHKRETQTPPRVEQAAQPNTQQANGAKVQQASPTAAKVPAAGQNTNNQQPIYNRPAANSNNQKQQPSNLNNQKQPVNAQKTQQNTQAQPKPVNSANKNQQPATANAQKNQQPAVPASNIQQKTPTNGQAAPVITSQSSRIRREAPKSTDQKATPQVTSNQQKSPAIAQVNSHKPLQPAQTPKVARETPKTQQPAVNVQQKPAAAPVSNQQKTQQPAQGSRVTREALENKPVDAKILAQASNSQKKSDAPSVPVAPQKQAQGSRITREAPRPAEQKPAQSVNAQKPVEQKAKAPAAPVTQQKQAQGSRITREAPKPAEQKPAQAVNAQKPVEQKAKAPAAPVNQQKPAQGSRITREAPVPAEQKPPQPLNAQKPSAPISKAPLTPPINSRPLREAPKASESNPSVAAKASDSSIKFSGSSESNEKPAVTQKKGSNVPQTVTLNYDHQSPSFVHPIPVDQILKKPAAVDQHHSSGPAVVGVTKTENVKIEASLPTSTSEQKPVSTSNIQKIAAKTN